MPRTRFYLPIILAPLLLGGCAGANGYNVGTDHSAGDNGSYSGYTLNSPTADQNPHVGGDQSYPASVSDQGKPLVPPDKVSGR